jgi:hypothetical protein
MSALAFAGGAAVGAPAAYLSMRQFAKDDSQIQKSSMSPDGKVLLQLMFSPRGIAFAHDILSATSAKIQKRNKWVQHEKSTEEYKKSFEEALSSLVNKYKDQTVQSEAAWPAGLAGLFAGGVMGIMGSAKDFLSNSLLMEYYESFVQKAVLSPKQKDAFKKNAAAIAVGAMLDVPQESPEALLTFVLEKSQDVQALWQLIDSELTKQVGPVPS